MSNVEGQLELAIREILSGVEMYPKGFSDVVFESFVDVLVECGIELPRARTLSALAMARATKWLTNENKRRGG